MPALTVIEVRNARPRDTAYKLADGGGLFLFVSPKGAKSWRMKYRFGGKEKLLTFGRYPHMGLNEARMRREEAKAMQRAGIDPGKHKAEAKAVALARAEHNFERVARDWHDSQRPRWSPPQAALILRALERDVFPALGESPVAEITVNDVLACLRKIEGRGSIETAKRVHGYMTRVFRRAAAEKLIPFNPAADIKDALRETPKGSKQPAITSVPGLITLQKSIDRSTSGPVVKLASRLIALTVVRVGVLRSAVWTEFNGIDWQDPDAPAPSALWRVPAARMKLEVESKGDAAYDHDVPLPAQAVEVLRALRVLTGKCEFLFPSYKSTAIPMSDAALSTVYKRRGYKGIHVPHGWRAAFSTIINEWAVDFGREGDRLAIDLMLAHAPRGASASEFAYNRARYSARRRELAMAWADMITEGLESPFDLLRGQAR